MSETYLTLAQVMERLQLAKSSVYRRIQDGTLPRPIKVGSLQRFKESEIEAAMDALAAKRKPQPQNGGQSDEPRFNFHPPARFNRPAKQNMSHSAFSEWNARDSVLSGANALPLRALAEAAEQRVIYNSGEGVCVTQQMRQERRRTKRKAERYVKKQTARIEQAYQRGDGQLVCLHVERLLGSFYARYIAYCDAWAGLKRRHRPHLYVLAEYAAQLDMNSLEFEAANMRFERKASADDGSKRPNDYRAITSFRIHHRARQKLVLMVLKACFPNHVRPDQYGVSGRGRKVAVEAVIDAMHDRRIEFVAEVDIKDFFPSIGEEEGCIIVPENALYEMFPFLPKAVIETTVLASRILVSLPVKADSQVLSHEFNPRTGVPQGSAVSSFISEIIMSEIITSAETCTHSGCVTIGYADNFAVLGICRDDVNQHVQSLSICARSSQYGAFRLSRSQTTRHKSEGFIYLGYYLRYYEDGGRPMVDVDISDKSVLKLSNRLRSDIERFRPTGYSRRDYILEKADEIAKRVVHWHRSFELCEHAEEKALEVLDNVFEEYPRQRNLLYDHIVDVLSH